MLVTGRGHGLGSSLVRGHGLVGHWFVGMALFGNWSVGMVFVGDIEKSSIIYSLMKDKVNVEDFKHVLVAENFGLASLPEELWRPRLELPSSKLVPVA